MPCANAWARAGASSSSGPCCIAAASPMGTRWKSHARSPWRCGVARCARASRSAGTGSRPGRAKGSTLSARTRATSAGWNAEALKYHWRPRVEEPSMKLGIFMMPVHPLHRNHTETLKEDRETVILADRLGFHDAFIGEHLTDKAENITNSLLFLATLIHSTQRKIG